MKKVVLLLLFTVNCSLFTAFGQSFKSLYKEGVKAASEHKTDLAIAFFLKAYKLDSTRVDMLIELAKQYDLKREYNKACANYDAVFSRDAWNVEAVKGKAMCFINHKRYVDAVALIDLVMEKNTYDHRLHYLRALAKDSMNDCSTACLEYVKAINIIKEFNIKYLSKYKYYYTNYATALYKTKVHDESIKNYTYALTLDPADTVLPLNNKINYLRSFPYLAKGDYSNAINDLTKAVIKNPTDKEFILARAEAYKKSNQFQSAISDYSKYILLNDKNGEVYSSRGQCYIELANHKEAVGDFKKAIHITHQKTDSLSLQSEELKYYEANRESDIPEIKIDYPSVDKNNFINVFDTQYDVLISGHIKDKSQIEFIKINGIDAKYNKDEFNPEFQCHIPLTNNLRTAEIVVSDIYHNKTTIPLKVGRIISDSRLVVRFAGKIVTDDNFRLPYKNQVVYLVNDKGEVFFAAKTDSSGFFAFQNLPFDQNYFLTMDVSDTKFAENKRYIITDEKNIPILVSKEEGNQHFKFEILQTDFSAMTLMTLDEAPLAIDIRGKMIANNDAKTPLANLTVILYNSKGEIVARKKTDEFGAFLFSKLIPQENYTISTDTAESNNLAFTKIFITDENGKILSELIKNKYGFYNYEILPTEKVLMSKISEYDPWLKTTILTKEKNQLTIIENIYYNSGSFEILPEGEKIIKKAIEALKGNLQLTLEIQSHTDAIAGDEYNMELSQNRANTVVAYMIANGIDKKRLTAKGFGETQLANRCANGIECSDAEHKQNRRTVFKINYIGK